MNRGTTLAVISFAMAAGNIAVYYPKMMSNRATLRPRREQAVMALVLLLAISPHATPTAENFGSQTSADRRFC